MSKDFKFNRKILPLLFVFSFPFQASAGMYIVNDEEGARHAPISQGASIVRASSASRHQSDASSPKVFPVSRSQNYKVISNSPSRYASVKPVIVGPVGFAQGVPIDIFLQQISPSDDDWKLNCSPILCGEKTVAWRSDGSVRWMDLFYNVISKDGKYDISFDTGKSVVSMSYIRGNVLNWKVAKGSTLKDTLSQWSEVAGYSLKWNTIGGIDWVVGNEFTLRGSYSDAMSSLIEAYKEQGIILSATKFKNDVIEVKQHYSEDGM